MVLFEIADRVERLTRTELPDAVRDDPENETIG
jgi:hypothetical protein